MDSKQSGAMRFGPFAFDSATGKLSKHGVPVRLRGMPLKILQHFLDRPGEVVSRTELQKLLWRDTEFGGFDQGLNTAVNVVRRTLGDSADQPRYIETMPGQGYRFIAPLERPPAEKVSEAASESSPVTKPSGKAIRRWMAALVAVALTGAVAWRMSRPSRPSLILGAAPSTNQDANDQYDLAMNFLGFQGDIPRARKAFEKALQIDPEFSSARLQRACLTVIDIYNGFSNDEAALLQAEQDLHRAEPTIPATDGLLLSTQAAVYFTQGRLDRVPRAGLNEFWVRNGGQLGSPVWVVLFPMLAGETERPLEILRTHLQRVPQEGPARMFLGELQRTMGDTANAVRTLELALEQGPRHPAAMYSLALAYWDHGKPELARSLLERSRTDLEGNYLWRHAWALVSAGMGKNREAELAMNDDTLKFARLAWQATSATADYYALQGDPSKAIEWLQLAAGRGDERTAYFRRNPRLAALRKDPRFESLLASIEARRR